LFSFSLYCPFRLGSEYFVKVSKKTGKVTAIGASGE